jgi:hypothetical protein
MFLNPFNRKPGTTNKDNRRQNNSTPADSFLSFDKDIRETRQMIKDWYDGSERAYSPGRVPQEMQPC